MSKVPKISYRAETKGQPPGRCEEQLGSEHKRSNVRLGIAIALAALLGTTIIIVSVPQCKYAMEVGVAPHATVNIVNGSTVIVQDGTFDILSLTIFGFQFMKIDYDAVMQMNTSAEVEQYMGQKYGNKTAITLVVFSPTQGIGSSDTDLRNKSAIYPQTPDMVTMLLYCMLGFNATAAYYNYYDCVFNGAVPIINTALVEMPQIIRAMPQWAILNSTAACGTHTYVLSSVTYDVGMVDAFNHPTGGQEITSAVLTVDGIGHTLSS